MSTHLRGPLGVIARTAEKGNADTSDNETHYCLADLMGNHLVTAREAMKLRVSHVFDAFLWTATAVRGQESYRWL